MMSDKFYHDRPLLPWQRNLTEKTKIHQNSISAGALPQNPLGELTYTLTHSLLRLTGWGS